MTRNEIYNQCIQEISKTNCILLELPTGFGKTALSIKICNYLLSSKWYKNAQAINILILVLFDFSDLKEDITATKVVVKILIVVVIIAFICGVVFLLNQILDWGLF